MLFFRSLFLHFRSGFFPWLAAACVAALFVGCGGGGTSSSTSSAPATVTGVVQDAGGALLSGVRVQLAGQSITTAADGRFSFTVSATTDSSVLLVKKAGFATNAKDAPIAPGNTTDITVKLQADQVNTNFAATSGITLSPNGASVAIPANAIQTAAGTVYSGTVTVAANYYGPDTVAGVQAFPAPYVGVDASTQSPLITMGVIEVKLTDASGNPLQLKSGTSATLIYPASTVSASAVVASIVPLWYYDETNVIWTREGQATKQANGTYQASVTHFTLWNADFKGVTATITGCFKDANGVAITKAGPVGLRGSGWSHQWLGTTQDGMFTVRLVPANMPLELYSASSSATFTTLAIPPLAPGEVRALPCLVVTNPPSGSGNVVTLPGTLFTTSTASFAGTYSGTYSGAELGSFLVTVNSSGQVTGTVRSTTYNLVASVTGTVGGTGAVSLATSGTAGSATFTGSIAGTGAVGGTWAYTNGGGTGTFTGQRQP